MTLYIYIYVYIYIYIYTYISISIYIPSILSIMKVIDTTKASLVVNKQIEKKDQINES